MQRWRSSTQDYLKKKMSKLHALSTAQLWVLHRPEGFRGDKSLVIKRMFMQNEFYPNSALLLPYCEIGDENHPLHRYKK
jgi:hypothetical protein